jgi:hypothetical protein
MAVTSGMLAAQMLPALMNPRDMMPMLMSSAEVRRALPRLLNFNRANEMRSVLHPMEWRNSLDDLLLADAEDLLRKAPIKNRALKAVMQSILDFFPELYLETIRLALDAAKYAEDHPEEYEDITQMPFALEDLLHDPGAAGTVPGTPLAVEAGEAAPGANGHKPSLTDIVPAAADPFLALATSRLSEARREQLEQELRDLLRQEIVAGGSFAQTDLARAAGRLLFQLRAGLEQAGGSTPEEAARILDKRDLPEISLLGGRVAERARQRALRLQGLKDWLDRSQKQFLVAMKTPEAGLEPKTGRPVLFVASRPNQPRDEWPPLSAGEIEQRMEEIAAWAGLARAAFVTPSRVQMIFASAKVKTAADAVRRTVLALCLYRRWEPELVHLPDDLNAFRRQFGQSGLGRLDRARDVVLQALDVTPDDAWKPADAKARARDLLLHAIDTLEQEPGNRPSAVDPG